jgi:ABC-type oligopeptide transport system substrate-binding subunit
MFMFSWRPSILDAGQVLNLSFRNANWGYAEDQEMEDLITESFAAADEDERLDLISQIWGINDEEVYFAPIFNDQYQYALRPDALRFTPRADGLIFAHQLELP